MKVGEIMESSTIIFIIAMGWALIIYGGITYLIVKKKEYSLISGFLNRPKEEQEYLIKNGYMEAMGRFFKITFYLFALAFLLGLLPIPYGFEVGITIFLLVLLVGMVWLQKYELPKKRKKMYWVTSSISIALFAFISGITIYGFSGNKVMIHNGTFEVSGMYGIEWKIADIESVELLDELPKVITKSNGFATSELLKGRFRLEDPYAGGLLFIKEKKAPYLYITTNSDYLILNRDDPKETLQLYKELKLSID